MTPPHGGIDGIGGDNYDLSNKETMRRAKSFEKARFGGGSDEEEDPEI